MKTVLLGLMLAIASFHVLGDSIAQEEAISPEQALVEVKKRPRKHPVRQWTTTSGKSSRVFS